MPQMAPPARRPPPNMRGRSLRSEVFVALPVPMARKARSRTLMGTNKESAVIPGV